MYLIIILITVFFNCTLISSAINKSNFNINGAVLSHIQKAKDMDLKNLKKCIIILKKLVITLFKLIHSVICEIFQYQQFFYGFDTTLYKENLINEIKQLHKKGFAVMLKPHVWVGGIKFNPENLRNKIDYSNPGERASWFHNYGNFIIKQAMIAENNEVEIFVIGTELAKLAKYDKEWKKIIKKVSDVYSGKITYAAEGSNAFKIEFWDGLDFIGLDVYFQLTNKINTELKDLEEGWKKNEEKIRQLSEKYNKKIIFTEIGYKSVKGTAVRPWEWRSGSKPAAASTCF